VFTPEGLFGILLATEGEGTVGWAEK